MASRKQNTTAQALSWRVAATLGALLALGCGSEDPAPYTYYPSGATGATIGTGADSTSTTGGSPTTGSGATGAGTTGLAGVDGNAAAIGGVTGSGASSTGSGTATGFGGAANTTGDTDDVTTGTPLTNTSGVAMNTGANMTSGGGATGGGMVPDEPYCAATMNWDAQWAMLEQEILEIVNQVRAEGADCGGEQMSPVGPLMMDPNLQCAARMHSLDMDDRDFFDHDNPDGDGPSERMEAAGYDGRGWGENIAAGNDTAEETMEQWMNSPGHCRNIMSDNYTLIGVGYHTGGQYGHLWTQTFGG